MTRRPDNLRAARHRAALFQLGLVDEAKLKLLVRDIPTAELRELPDEVAQEELRRRGGENRPSHLR